MSGARLAARCVELLGPVDGRVAVRASARMRAALAARIPLAEDGATAAAAVCAFLGEAADPRARRLALDAFARRLSPGAPLVVVDHNQPRGRLRRFLAAAVLVLSGIPPARARHPTARELRSNGWTVDALRLADGERIQLVRAHRA